MQFSTLLLHGCCVCADPYFSGLSQPGREPSAQPVSKLSFEFERRKLTTDEVSNLNIPYAELLSTCHANIVITRLGNTIPSFLRKHIADVDQSYDVYVFCY